MSVVACVVRKLRPCPSYSRRRDRINLGLWRSLYKGGGSLFWEAFTRIHVDTVHISSKVRAMPVAPHNSRTHWFRPQEFENNSASSQIFWLLKDSELTPVGNNVLDGRYACFGYITENQDLLKEMKACPVCPICVGWQVGLDPPPPPAKTSRSSPQKVSQDLLYPNVNGSQ